jgi:hypothetical protein
MKKSNVKLEADQDEETGVYLLPSRVMIYHEIYAADDLNESINLSETQVKVLVPLLQKWLERKAKKN